MADNTFFLFHIFSFQKQLAQAAGIARPYPAELEDIAG